MPDPHVKRAPRLKHVAGPAVSAPVLQLEQSRGEVLQMIMQRDGAALRLRLIESGAVRKTLPLPPSWGFPMPL